MLREKIQNEIALINFRYSVEQKTQAETIFDLLEREDEKLSLGNYRLNFLASREEMVELMEKIALVIDDDGWVESRVWVAQAHRKALENDREEKRVALLEKLGLN